MKFFIATILLAACAAVQGRSVQVHPIISMMDYRMGLDTRIIDGTFAVNGQLPWQASLFVTKKGTSARELCGGSLISDTFILTAAHCLTNAVSIEIHLGGVNLWTGMEYNQISKQFMQHENYNPANFQNDIGLVTLPVPATITDNLQTIPLAARSQPDLTGKPVRVSGYGKTLTSVNSQILQFVDLTAISNDECKKYFPPNVFETTLCARGSPHHSTCQGDSGGPVVHYDQHASLVGVISFASGAGCALGYPTGHTRVSSYLDWINQKTGIPIRD